MARTWGWLALAPVIESGQPSEFGGLAPELYISTMAQLLSILSRCQGTMLCVKNRSCMQLVRLLMVQYRCMPLGSPWLELRSIYRAAHVLRPAVLWHKHAELQCIRAKHIKTGIMQKSALLLYPHLAQCIFGVAHHALLMPLQVLLSRGHSKLASTRSILQHTAKRSLACLSFWQMGHTQLW